MRFILVSTVVLIFLKGLIFSCMANGTRDDVGMNKAAIDFADDTDSRLRGDPPKDSENGAILEPTETPCSGNCAQGFSCMTRCRSECVRSLVPIPEVEIVPEPCIELGDSGCFEGHRDNCCEGSYCKNYGPKSRPLKKCNKCSQRGESCELDACCGAGVCGDEHVCA